MNLPFYIAKRHFFAKKKQNAVNIISSISVLVVAVVTAAMIIVLSAFNGIESLVLSFYNSVEPDITIEPAIGKTLSPAEIELIQQQLPNDELFPSLIVDGIVRYDGNQQVCKLYGVTKAYLDKKEFDTLLVDGFSESFNGVFLGLGVKYQLEVPAVENAFRPVSLLLSQRGKKINMINGGQNLVSLPLNINGVFSINGEYDTEYAFVPYQKLAERTNNKKRVSYLAIVGDAKKLKPYIEEQLKNIPNIIVKTQQEKNSLIYETSKSEKWFTYIILLFITCIGAFNIIASVTMLMIDKKEDMFTLQSFGMSPKQLGRIFFYEGLFINGLGILVGLTLGLGFCWLQQMFGLVPIQGATVSHYPVLIKWQDVVLVALGVSLIGLLFTLWPVIWQTKKRAV